MRAKKRREENLEPNETVRGSFTVLEFIIFFISMDNPLQVKILCEGKRSNHSHQIYRIEERSLLSSDNYVCRKTERLSYSLLLQSLLRYFEISTSWFLLGVSFSFFFPFLGNNDHRTVNCKICTYSDSKLLKIFSRENKKSNQCRREGISQCLKITIMSNLIKSHCPFIQYCYTGVVHLLKNTFFSPAFISSLNYHIIVHK